MNFCKQCGDTAPEGHELCWSCEHEPKLGLKEEESKCSDDSCEIDFANEDSTKRGNVTSKVYES